MLTLFLSLAMAGDASATTGDSQSAEDNKVVCRSEWTVGSRIPVRTCRSKKEWDQIEEANTRELQNRSNYSRGTQNSNAP